MHPTAALSITVILEGEPGSRCPGGDSLLDIPHLQVVILNLNYPVVLGVVAEGGEPRRHLHTETYVPTGTLSWLVSRQ